MCPPAVAGVPPLPCLTTWKKEKPMAEPRETNIDEKDSEKKDEAVDFVADPVSDEELEDVSGGTTVCANGYLQ